MVWEAMEIVRITMSVIELERELQLQAVVLVCSSCPDIKETLFTSHMIKFTTIVYK